MNGVLSVSWYPAQECKPPRLKLPKKDNKTHSMLFDGRFTSKKKFKTPQIGKWFVWPGRGRDVVLVAARLRATSKWRSACTWEEAGSSNGRGRSGEELWEAGSPAHSNACFGWCAPGAWSTEEPELVQTGLTQDRFPV